MDTQPQWLTAAPPEVLRGEGLLLRRPTEPSIEALSDAVQASMTELHRFMPWAVEGYGIDEARTYVTRAASTWEDHSDFPYLIHESAPPDAVCGSAGLINRVGPGVLEIGYWVATPHTGHRIARRAAILLIQAARALPDVRAVEIHHDEANLASRTVPMALGFTQVEVRQTPIDAPDTTGRTAIWSLAL